MRRSRVVLPDPDSPMIATNSPASTEKSAMSTAGASVLGYWNLRRSTRMPLMVRLSYSRGSSLRSRPRGLSESPAR